MQMSKHEHVRGNCSSKIWKYKKKNSVEKLPGNRSVFLGKINELVFSETYEWGEGDHCSLNCTPPPTLTWKLQPPPPNIPAVN